MSLNLATVHDRDGPGHAGGVPGTRARCGLATHITGCASATHITGCASATHITEGADRRTVDARIRNHAPTTG